MTAIFDLSDVQFQVRGLTEEYPQGNGYAYLPDSGEPVVGRDALRYARLHPTRINNRFWGDLNTEPAKPAHPKIRHNADLAWYHLKKFSEATTNKPTAFVFPSNYDSQTLQLLVGVAKSLEIDVKLLINRAVASAMTVALENEDSSKEFVHIELQQHQLVLSYMQMDGHKLKLRDYERLPARGLSRIQEKWLHILRHRFIESSRFDPMHSGDSEQQLFDQLNNLSGTGVSSYKFSITNDEETLVDEVTADVLADPVLSLMSEIRDRVGDRIVCLHALFASLPGIQLQSNEFCVSSDDLFRGIGLILDDQEVASEDTQVIESALLSTGVAHDNSGQAANPDKGTQSLDNQEKATHILVGGYAYPADTYVVDIADGRLHLQKTSAASKAHFVLEKNRFSYGPSVQSLPMAASGVVPGAELVVGDELVIHDQHKPIMAIALGKQD